MTNEWLIDTQKFKNFFDFIHPPGYYRGYIDRNSKCIKVDIFDNHRFLFYSLITLNYDVVKDLSICNPMILISFDYHTDLEAPTDSEKKDLCVLDLNNHKEVAYFCWNHLSHLNDNHILSAVYLNLFTDVYVLQKQRDNDSFIYYDKDNNPHTISVFKDQDDFINNILKVNNNSQIVLDIDLDFFTKMDLDTASGHMKTNIDTNKTYFEILKFVCNQFQKIELLTIAKEPECCGGLMKSNLIFSKLHAVLFDGDVLSKYDPSCTCKMII